MKEKPSKLAQKRLRTLHPLTTIRWMETNYPDWDRQEIQDYLESLYGQQIEPPSKKNTEQSGKKKTRPDSD